jgi:hypothetical protein
MCEPMTMLMAAGTVASTAVSMFGASQKGDAQADAYNARAAEYAANAALDRRQATIGQITSQYEERQKQAAVAKLTATQINQYATTGMTLDGSPTDVILDTASQGALDVQAIQWNADLKASNKNFEAGIKDMNADTSRRAAKTARTTGNIETLQAGLKGANSLLGLKF